MRDQGPPGFQRFWLAWPNHERKVNRKGALAYWERHGLEEIAGEIVAGLDRWKHSVCWHKDGGQFIPLVMTWLNQERWEATPPQLARYTRPSGSYINGTGGRMIPLNETSPAPSQEHRLKMA